jgi:hypothetical protein
MREMSGGVTSGFPIISYKGKVWRIRKSGEEQMHLDTEGNAMPVIEVILIKGNPNPSKNFFDKQYEEGSNEPPRCFSNDGIRPDASIQDPINSVCASCPNNAWGSRITPQGKKARACNDVRRMAVVFAHDLNESGPDAQLMLLRVPPASLNPLKDYAEKVLGPKGVPFFSIVTSIGFDVNAAHPQFVFKAKRFVNAEEADAIIALRESEDARRILAEAIEFPAGAEQDTGSATPGAQQAATGMVPPAQQAAQPAAAPAAKLSDSLPCVD